MSLNEPDYHPLLQFWALASFYYRKQQTISATFLIIAGVSFDPYGRFFICKISQFSIRTVEHSFI